VRSVVAVSFVAELERRELAQLHLDGVLVQVVRAAHEVNARV